jgi:ABC-type glycerol-3-phosphate transport system substrate-binding protein
VSNRDEGGLQVTDESQVNGTTGARSTRRRFLQTGVAVGGGLALATPTQAARSVFVAQKKVTINYWTWHHISQVPTEKGKDRIKAAFEKANPNITLNVKLFPYPDYVTALQTAIPSGSAGHVLGLQNGAISRTSPRSSARTA